MRKNPGQMTGSEIKRKQEGVTTALEHFTTNIYHVSCKFCRVDGHLISRCTKYFWLNRCKPDVQTTNAPVLNLNLKLAWAIKISYPANIIIANLKEILAQYIRTARKKRSVDIPVSIFPVDQKVNTKRGVQARSLPFCSCHGEGKDFTAGSVVLEKGR